MPDNNAAYMKLITSEYADKPNYNAYVKSFLDKVSPIVDSFDSFNTLFNIDNAVGDQLDKIGQIVGVQRELPISDPDIPSVLDDDLFRAVIKARIYSNLWDGTNEGLIKLSGADKNPVVRIYAVNDGLLDKFFIAIFYVCTLISFLRRQR